MANIFEGLTTYNAKWEKVGERDFNAAEIAAITSAKVTRSDYGKSVQFTMVRGGVTYIPLSNQSNLEIGADVDITKAKLITLHQPGKGNIVRVEA